MELKDCTLKDIITIRPDLITAILSGEHGGTTVVSIIRDVKGRVKKWTEERRDIDGILISRRVDDCTYYETGEIDEINMKRYNDKGVLTEEKTVKHFSDGRPPVTTDADTGGEP